MDNPDKAPLVICGHGMVAQRLLENLVAGGHPYHRIVVFNAEPFNAYNRVRLSSLLAGEIEEPELELKPWQWYRKNRIEVCNHEPVVTIHPGQQQVVTASGRTEVYRKLVLATGSRPSRLGIPGEDLEGVLYFRDLADTRTLISHAGKYRHAVVIGGGFLGLEAAEGLRARGLAVTVLHRGDYLLNRQLDASAGALLEHKLQQRGLETLTGTAPVALLGQGRVSAVRLSDGTVITTDLVVIATGITPDCELAATAGLSCDRGILVDAHLLTSDPHIHALGECCQHGEHTFGLVEPGYLQADILARCLGQATRSRGFAPGQTATRLKISGLPIFSCGQIEPGPATEVIRWQDRAHHTYGRLLIERNRLIGAVLLGDTSNGPWYGELINRGTDISGYRDTLAFGKSYSNAAALTAA